MSLSADLRRVVERYLSWRRGLCPHTARPMVSTVDPAGVHRCGSCGDLIDFLAAPLLIGRSMTAFTERSLRREFAHFRRSLRLRPWLHFDVLADTFAEGRSGPLR